MGPRFKYYLVLESLFYFYECLAHWEKKKKNNPVRTHLHLMATENLSSILPSQ